MENKLSVGSLLFYIINRFKYKNIELKINNGTLISTWDEINLVDNLFAVHVVVKRRGILYDEIILALKDRQYIEKIAFSNFNKNEANIEFKIIGSFYRNRNDVNLSLKYDKKNNLLLSYYSKNFESCGYKPIKVLSLYNVFDDVPIVVSEGGALKRFNMDYSKLEEKNKLLLNSSDSERRSVYKKTK